VRKVAPVESLEGLTVETALLTPFALAYMAWLASNDALIFGDAPGLTALLVLAGAVTAVPLLLFAGAARRLPYSTLGLLQYLAPTLQFLLAITVFGEAMTLSHIVCFALIWSGLALYVLSSVRKPRPVPAEWGFCGSARLGLCAGPWRSPPALPRISMLRSMPWLPPVTCPPTSTVAR